MNRVTFWPALVAFILAWSANRPRATAHAIREHRFEHAHPDLAAAIRAAADARARRDTRSQHDAELKARRLRTHALMIEQGLAQ